MEQFISGLEEGVVMYCQYLLGRDPDRIGDVLMAIHALPVSTTVRCRIYDTVVRTACPLSSAEVRKNAIELASVYVEL